MTDKELNEFRAEQAVADRKAAAHRQCDKEELWQRRILTWAAVGWVVLQIVDSFNGY